MRAYTGQYKWVVAALIFLTLALASARLEPLLSATFSAVSAYAQSTQKGRVTKVTDGDTVVIQPTEGGQFYKCRLYGIDAPETRHGRKAGQPYGDEASKELKRLSLGQTVDVTLTGQKTYNREVCRIEKDGVDINLEMVKLGYAWAYVQYLKRPHASTYIDAEREARSNKLGLWHDSNPTPPWEFRKMQKKRKRF